MVRFPVVLVLVEVLRGWGVVEGQVPGEHLQGDIQVMNELVMGVVGNTS